MFGRTKAVVAAGVVVAVMVVGGLKVTLPNSDVTPPSVSMTAPSGTVSGASVTVSATASDDVQVASVQFQVDGSNIGSADTTAPYSITWDSTTVTDGVHDITAVASDEASNTTTSAQDSITVSNSAPAATANVWLATSAANNCTGGRSSTPITFAAAQAANDVCTTFAKACTTATGGDTVMVRAGRYPYEDSGTRSILWTNDCSDGTASDYDPTAQSAGTVPSAPSNWVTFKAEDGCTKDSIRDGSTGSNIADWLFESNAHVFFEGTSARCFYFTQLHLDYVGDSGVNTKNLIFHNVDLLAFQVNGAANIWLDSFEQGPAIWCDSLGGTAQCQNPGNGTFESRLSTYSGGSKQFNGIQFPMIRGNASTSPDNIVVSNGVSHDESTYNSGLYHGGCGWFSTGSGHPDNSFILRNIKCERINIQGWFIESTSSGMTFENDQNACVTYPYTDGNNPSHLWDLCTSPAKVSFLVKSTAGSVTNILIRYNSWVGGIDLPSGPTYSNVRIIGNIYAGESTCPGSGVIWDYNSTTAANCGAATHNTSISSPFTDSDATSPGDGPVGDVTVSGGDGKGSTTNFHLSGAPGSCACENSVTPTSSDYALTIDMDGASRAAPRDAGADER